MREKKVGRKDRCTQKDENKRRGRKVRAEGKGTEDVT